MHIAHDCTYSNILDTSQGFHLEVAGGQNDCHKDFLVPPPTSSPPPPTPPHTHTPFPPRTNSMITRLRQNYE